MMNLTIKSKKWKISRKFNFCAIFIVILIILSLICDCDSAGACDRSRKIFEGVGYGEITDGINSNYTQVRNCWYTN